MEKIIILGGGGHAKAVITVIKKTGRFEILGYLDITNRGEILGIKFLGDDERLSDIKREHPQCAAALGVGHVSISSKRCELKSKLEDLKFDLPAIISPTAIINEDVKIGKGSVVHDGVIVNSGAVIGECSIINNNSTIDHDCQIADFVHIAPGATLSGGVEVGARSIVGAGASVIQNTIIGDDCLIGAGAVVTDKCEEPGTYVGIPVRRT